MAEYLNKTGSVTYTVITDTHGYRWGSIDADFDLGDNTITDGTVREPIQPTNASKMALYGNHDVAQLIAENKVLDSSHQKSLKKGVQIYRDTAHKVLVLGLDSAKEISKYEIPSEEITEVAEILKTLEADWDVIVLTHVPLFLACSEDDGCWGTKETKKWDRFNESIKNQETDTEDNWMKSPNDLLLVLRAFHEKVSFAYDHVTYDFGSLSNQTNHVIGCFCGHIHCSVVYPTAPRSNGNEGLNQKIFDKKIYMESFRTNGDTEYDNVGHGNRGAYTPYPSPCEIVIDFEAHTVNGVSYENPSVVDGHILTAQNSGKAYADRAVGTVALLENYYPKFYAGKYIGWSRSDAPGADLNAEKAFDHYYNIRTYVHGLGKYVDYVRFSADGTLKYFSQSGNDIEQELISDYGSAVRFLSNDTVWRFNSGSLISTTAVGKTIKPRSGVMKGKNGYTLTFNEHGMATGIKLNDTPRTYGAGENWINVSSIRVYPDFLNLPESYNLIVNTAQVGITDVFDSYGSALTLARSTSAGENVLSSNPCKMIRVLDENGDAFWFYDGILTNLTDAQMGVGATDLSVEYTSGEIIGKNGYSIVFGDRGHALSIKRNGVEQGDYGAGNNWINVSTIRVYPDFENNPDTYQYTADAAQIGITGSFDSLTHIDVARSGANGTNWLNERYLWMRVMDEAGTAHWLYDGRMTPYTDAYMLGLDPTYVSGEIVGKNGYSITFKTGGYAKAITLNGVEKTYTAGNNWINVSTIRVYPDYESDYDDYQYTPNAAQIGITGTFGSATRINMARSGINGSNWLTSRYLLMRVMDEEGTAHWLYDGRLTNYTDADIEK